MTTTQIVLFESKEAENTQTTQYTSTNCKTIIDKFTAYNKTAGNVTLTINLVAPAGSAGGTNSTISKSIPPGITWTFPELIGHSLEPGGFISTLASAAASLNMRSAGRQIT